jgi:hypothetical protein
LRPVVEAGCHHEKDNERENDIDQRRQVDFDIVIAGCGIQTHLA